MDQAFQYLTDHFKMIALVGELTFQIDEIGCGGVEALRKQLGDEKRDLRIRSEKSRRLVKYMNLDRGLRLDRRRVRKIQQYGHFTEDRSGLLDQGDLRVASQDLHVSFDKDKEPARPFLLLEQDRSGLKPFAPSCRAMFEN